MSKVKAVIWLAGVFCILGAVNLQADMFGTGQNQFTIDFTTISGDAGSADGTYIGYGKPGGFVDPGYDYRMGVYEVTVSQWQGFEREVGIRVADDQPYWRGSDMPVSNISWYEMAQFVNWLNTSTEHQPAYKFTGTQGTDDYTWEKWSSEEAMDRTHRYRHKDAHYFLPTDDELVKAGYWNGNEIQKWATKDNSQPVAGVDTNYNQVIGKPWDVGSGSEELNGTYDIMGNLWEWTESPYEGKDPDNWRVTRGGTYAATYNPDLPDWTLVSNMRGSRGPSYGSKYVGFRIASVPEPASILLLGLGGIFLKVKEGR